MNYRFNFLSRLCGGEPLDLVKLDFAIFLSRLCGGELLLIVDPSRESFLSRLCGGERAVPRA